MDPAPNPTWFPRMPTRNKASWRSQQVAALLGRVDIWTCTGWTSNECSRTSLPRLRKLKPRLAPTAVPRLCRLTAVLQLLRGSFRAYETPGCCENIRYFPDGNCSEGSNDQTEFAYVHHHNHVRIGNTEIHSCQFESLSRNTSSGKAALPDGVMQCI